MATVTSLTETRIRELLGGWESFSLTQDEINALVIRLGTDVEAQSSALEHFNEVVVPHLEATTAESANAISSLNESLPALQSDLDQANQEIQNLVTIDVPALQQDMNNTMTNVEERPNTYIQATEPENPDENDRDLVVGDVWFNTSDNNAQRIWNGVEWTTFKVDVADFSLTVKSFISTRHQLY